MKRLTLEQAAFVLQALVAILLIFAVSGCVSPNSPMADFDRDYSLGYDATTGQGRLGGRISPANKPGEGRPSLGWEITGSGKSFIPLER